MERQMDQWDLVIKVKHGDTLRRIGAYVHGQLMDLNMSKLRSKIISLFKISHDAELILSYTDEDGDIVTLEDDDELRDAVIGQRLNPLRITVQLESPDSSDARPERSSPSSSVNAPRHVVIPTVVEQENTIPEPLLGVVSNLAGNAQKTLSSSLAFAQKVVDVMKSEPSRSAMESPSKDVKKATSLSPALAQVVEHLSNLGLSNAGQTSGPSCESSGLHRKASTHRRDLNVSEEPKDSNGPIREDIELPSDTARSINQIPNENRSGNVVVQGARVMSPSVDRNVQGAVAKNGKASLYPMDDSLASIWTASNFPEHEEEVCNTYLKVYNIPPTNQALHGSLNYWTPAQRIPINLDGGSSSKQPSMKADLSSASQTGFNSQAKVPISGPSRAIADADILKMLCGMPEGQRTKWESRFIRDVTVLDGTVMPPSTHFTKIWRMRNNGSVPWPIGTQLVWVGGDQFGDRVSAHLEIPQLGIPVDKELDIAVDFTAPARPGRYVSYWRMASPYGKKFGQRVWVLIQVDCSRPNSAAGTSFHPRLNLNLPPESNGGDRSVNIDEDRVERAVEDVSGGHVEQPAPVAGGLDASNDELSQPSPVATTTNFWISPLELLSDASFAIAVTAGDGKHVEQTLLKEREEMFKAQIERNKEILRLNDLCGYAEWDPLLSELKEMGFNDKELNTKLMMKNGGSIKRTVLDLIAGKASE